jgi:DNA-binding transcriptional MerR regulator
MTLSEIRILLGLRDNPAQDCGDVNALLDAHIRQTEDRVEALLQLKRHMQRIA